MESLILFIIIALVSSFFSSSKKRHDQSTPPIQKKHRQRPKIEIKTLDEFAKEVMKQLTEEKEENQKNEPVMVDMKPQEPSPIQQQVQPVPNKIELKERSNQTPVKMKETTSHPRVNHKLPFLSSKEALRNAIITQEILGPPKSKKR